MPFYLHMACLIAMLWFAYNVGCAKQQGKIAIAWLFRLSVVATLGVWIMVAVTW